MIKVEKYWKLRGMGANDLHDYYTHKDQLIEYKFISQWVYQYCLSVVFS